MLAHGVFLVLRQIQAWRNRRERLSHFQMFSHIQAWRDPCEMLSDVQVLSHSHMLCHFQASGDRCRRVNEFEIWRVCKILTWKGKEFCPNKEIFTTAFEKKDDHVFQGECEARTRSSDAQSELDRREWRMRNADIALYETGMQLPENGTLSGK